MATPTRLWTYWLQSLVVIIGHLPGSRAPEVMNNKSAGIELHFRFIHVHFFWRNGRCAQAHLFHGWLACFYCWSGLPRNAVAGSFQESILMTSKPSLVSTSKSRQLVTVTNCLPFTVCSRAVRRVIGTWSFIDRLPQIENSKRLIKRAPIHCSPLQWLEWGCDSTALLSALA